MTTHTVLRLGAVGLILIAIALLGGSHLCAGALSTATLDPGARPLGSDAFACAEFWLNRYQTLITAVIAVIALRGIRYSQQQARSALKQSSVSSIQFWSDRLCKLYELEERWIDIENKVARCPSTVETSAEKLLIERNRDFLKIALPVLKASFNTLFSQSSFERDRIIKNIDGIICVLDSIVTYKYDPNDTIVASPFPAQIRQFINQINRNEIRYEITLEIMKVKAFISEIEKVLSETR